VTTVANINRWKGLDVFLDAAAIVHRQHPDTVFVIAGDKTDRDCYHQLCSRAEQLGLASHVFFVGRVEDVPSLLLASDVFALLSQTEGFPNVVIEAMAAGIPVVATDVGGTSEALIDGLSGYLVPNGDHEAAAARIHSLLSQPDQARSLIRAARALVETKFSMEAMVQRHVEVYDALLST
jgi:glycosyltransferase involved in cell wall biosynthesis